MSELSMLQKPIKVGNLTLKHRLILGPMWTRYCTVDGEVTQQMIDYYAARAKGGASMVAIEATGVDGRYIWYEPTLRLDHKVYQAGFAKLIEAIHLYKVPVLIELANLGTFSINPISPSGVPSVLLGGVGIIQPRAASLEEIEEQRDKYIEAAVRGKEVGCDGVIIHGSTAYFLHQFLSPFTNKRNDKYGGSPEKRMRLPLEIVSGIRKKCGTDFVVGFALIADEFMPGGLTLENSIPLAKALEEEGVDYLDICIGTYETFSSTDRVSGQNKYLRHGAWEYSRPFKQNTKLPVSLRAQGDYDPVSWDKHVAAGDADIIQIAKPSLCDPDIFNKAVKNKIDDIRPCTICMYCCQIGTIGPEQVKCALNPETSRERDYAIQKVGKGKKVVIVGAGPGGLEAARVAASRGHDVTLMDKSSELGGKLNLIARCSGNETYGTFLNWEIKRCKEAGVKFKLNTEVTPEMIRDLKPDAVFLATGAPKHDIPGISGISNPNVLLPEDVLTGKAKISGKVVVINGNRIGIDIAYTIRKNELAEQVTIVEPKAVPVIGYDMEIMNMAIMTTCFLPKLKIEVMTGTNIEKVEADGLVVIQDGKKQKIKADTIILAPNYISDKKLYEALNGQIEELYVIGDCVQPRNVRDAIHEAAFFARQV